MDEWLKHTKQSWKLRVAVMFALVPAPSLVVLRLVFKDTAWAAHLSWQVVVASLLLAAGLAIVWLAVAVRCPQCGARVVLQELLSSDPDDLSDSFAGLAILSRCRACGYKPAGMAGPEGMAGRWSRLFKG